MVRVARAVTEKRIEPVDALDQTLTYKYKNVGVMRTSFTGHFETFDLKYLTKAQRKATVKPVAKVEEPVVEAPVVIEPVAEEPVVTEPVVEEPVVEEVKAEESTPTLEEVLAQLRQAVRS